MKLKKLLRYYHEYAEPLRIRYNGNTYRMTKEYAIKHMGDAKIDEYEVVNDVLTINLLAKRS